MMLLCDNEMNVFSDTLYYIITSWVRQGAVYCRWVQQPDRLDKSNEKWNLQHFHKQDTEAEENNIQQRDHFSQYVCF